MFLKEDHNKKQKEQAEATHITNDVSIYSQLHPLSHAQTQSNWIFDTAACSHMLSNLDKFDTIIEDHGIVEVGEGVYLKYEERGSCLVHLLLPDGSINQIFLKNVLFVLDLGHNLISWNVLRMRFY